MENLIQFFTLIPILFVFGCTAPCIFTIGGSAVLSLFKECVLRPFLIRKSKTKTKPFFSSEMFSLAAPLYKQFADENKNAFLLIEGVADCMVLVRIRTYFELRVLAVPGTPYLVVAFL